MESSTNQQYLILKNHFSRHPSSQKKFVAYCDFCIQTSSKLDDIQQAVSYLKAADVAIEVFSEKARFNEEKLNLVTKYKDKIDCLYKVIDDQITKMQQQQTVIELEAEKASVELVQKNNEKILKSISILQSELKEADDQTTFDECISKLTKLDSSLDKDTFTEHQSTEYSRLSESYSLLVSDKMVELQKRKDEAYNRRALNAFNGVFKKIKEDDKVLKKFDVEARLVVKTLFLYDTSRLFPEVQIYYNHVYSFIFAKLNDEGKFEFTRMSLDKSDIYE